MNHFTAMKHISEWFIKPKYEVEESKHPYYLGPGDLLGLSVHYIQKGLLFAKPCYSEYSIEKLIEGMMESLSLTLVHFYPLAGQFATQVDEDRHASLVFLDPNKGPGARFIHATLHMTMSDILSPIDVPLVVTSFFDHDRAVNHDGHTRPLLSVQITELLDGVFIGVSFNHAVGDGTSYWHFWKMWSEIHRERVANDGKQICISNPPVYKCWVPDGYDPSISLPFTHQDEFISRYEPPPVRERFFHFSSESVAKLKAKANEESNTKKISSFQAQSALVWRSIIRANHQPNNQVTKCRLSNNRHKLDPPLPTNYFGNCFGVVTAATSVGELLQHSLGWAALMLNQCVANYTDNTVCDSVKQWMHSRFVHQYGTVVNSSTVTIGSSPRFDMYGNEFGLGKAVAVGSGSANKFPGKVSGYPGYEGGGSVDLEICLSPESMGALELDEEFMAAVSFPSREY